MRIVIQRVLEAKVEVDSKCIGKIGKGFLILLGVGQDDDKKIADKYIDKILKLRTFADENGKTNLSLKDVEGEVLVVSQFTLYADVEREIDLIFSRPEVLKKQRNYMSIS